MNKRLFIILNIIATFFEISFITWIIFHFKCIACVFYYLYLILVLLVFILKKAKFKTIEFPSNLEEEINKVYNDFHKLYPNTNIKIKYVNDSRFIESAAFTQGTIYVNSKIKINSLFLDGIIAHELGHAESNYIKFYFIYSLRITNAFTRLIYLARYHFRKFFTTLIGRILDIFLIVIYNIFSLINHIVFNPFIRREELYANSIAVKIGYGDSLRYLYYMNTQNNNKETKNIEKYYDNVHPNLTLMLQEVENNMHLNEAEIDVLAVNNKIQRVLNCNSIKEKNDKILKWYDYKSSLDIKEIQYELGIIYLTGKYQVKKSLEKAKYYLNKAKSNNYFPAIYKLALIFHNEDTANKEKLFKDFKELSVNGYKKAYQYYGLYLVSGIGCIENISEGEYWLEKAVKHRSNLASIYFKIIGNEYIYEAQDKNSTEVSKESLNFISMNKVIRITDNKEEIIYKTIIKPGKIILIGNIKNDILELFINANKLIRKKIIINKNVNEYNKLIIYKKKSHNQNGDDQYETKGKTINT